ncbi:MAG: TrkH family potassium uptake protein [Bacteroidales bacterium]|nr:TrkH family potassium uptake protein [Bacteroidales bacterium]
MKLINPLIILRILSTLFLLETVSFLSCLPVAHIYSEPPYPFLWSSLITISISVVLYLLTIRSAFDRITNREGFLSVSLGWIFFTALGALPYLLSGTITSFFDAFFESASGFTTTGASILQNVEILPHSILFYRSLTHWIGGLGIIVLVIIILPALKITRFQFLGLESSLKEKIHPKTKSVGIRLLYIYISLTVLETILLVIGGMNLFESICHSFGTVATGGFSTRNDSLASFSPYIQYIILLFMFLAGVSYIIYYYMVKLNFKKVKQNEELWFYLATVVIAGMVATAILFTKTSRPFEVAFREGFFHVISLVTTTGFASADYLLWPSAGFFLVFMLLFTGASTGSTTGGIKMVRHLLVIKNIRNAFVRILHPNVINQVRLNGKLLPEKNNISIMSFITLYIFIFIIGTIVIVATGVDLVTGASAVASSLGNIGPGLGNIGPMNNFSHFSDFNKLIFSILMIVGRLEIFTIYVVFTRSFWRL